jgi:CRP-like cAMP-binding protein
MENAEIGCIPKEDFTKLLYSNHTVSQKFIDMISNNLVEIQDQLINMAFSSVRQRAARALLYLFNKGVIRTNANTGIGVPRDDFAGIIGTAKETAVRILTDFKNEGIIAMDTGRRIILLEPDVLKNEAGFDHDPSTIARK